MNQNIGLLRDGLNLDKNGLNDFLEDLNEISNMIAASIITLKNKKF